MTGLSGRPRLLGTMVTCGYPKVSLGADLRLAERLGVRCLELLPHWATAPDPAAVRREIEAANFSIHSVHGCWGGQSIQASRVDLADPDRAGRQASLDDLKRCLDWLRGVGGRCLVVHPGGLSDPADAPARTDALSRSLESLANEVQATNVVICVENMPTGVHPGSRMADLARLVSGLNRPEIGLIVDTGHAHIVSSAAEETLAAGRWLRSTHVHDNDGRQDTHLPPGAGSVDWNRWLSALEAIDYRGPIVLECIRHLRRVPESWDGRFLGWLDRFGVG